MPPTLSKAYLARTEKVFNCHCKIKLPIEWGEGWIDRCFGVLADIDARYNSHQPGSHFHRINRNAGQWVEVDETCVAMIRALDRISCLTAGAFDITCMPLIRLWGFYRSSHRTMPSASEIRETLARVGHRKIAVDGTRVKIEPGQEIITGSFIKAFAVDQVGKMIRAANVTDAVINAGGSTIMALNDADHPSWAVNIPDPEDAGKTARKIRISNQCFSLSARANNHLVIEGRVCGHILDSRTGVPSPVAQIGVVTDDAFLGDALSTALFSVSEKELEGVVMALREHFDFEYFRVEGHGNQSSSACF